MTSLSDEPTTATPEAESQTRHQRSGEAPLVLTILQIVFLPAYLFIVSHAILTCTHPTLSVFFLGVALAELIGMGLVYGHRPHEDRIRMLEMLSACTGLQVMALLIVLIWKLFWAASGPTLLGVEVKKWSEITHTKFPPTNECSLSNGPGFGFFLCSISIVAVVLVAWPYLTGFSWPGSHWLRSFRSGNTSPARDQPEDSDDEDGEDVQLLRVNTTTGNVSMKSSVPAEPVPYSAGPPAYEHV